MPSAPPNATVDPALPRDREDSARAVIPSWFASLCLHALILMLFASSRMTGGGGSGEDTEPGAGDFREVGLVARPEPQASDSDAPNETAEPRENANAFPDEAPGLTEVAPVADRPPVALPSASDFPPVLGPGNGPPIQGSQDARNPVRPNRVGSPGQGAAAGLGVGKVGFFGQTDNATRVVFVVDRSSSMESYGALRAAKAELMASLQGLERTQQFQIVFYNDDPTPLVLDSDPKPGVYFATQINRNVARQFIDAARADGGTRHLPALKTALRMSPEVIFFLTDADSGLTAKEMDEVLKLNQGRSRIHSIEFGKGPDLPNANLENWLKKLARLNGGNYRYRDVTRFESR